ncbi:MAG: DUF349 domain-containing protein, partial [Bacteroidales bacterium]|nr:DUF349 domain-containing protein [Bacteroidales bacterium]
MEPKDLKNSDELKVMPDIKENNSKINIDQVEENVKENVTDKQESGEKLQLADDIRTVSGDDKIISPGSREAEVTDSSAVADSLAGQTESSAEDLAEQAESLVEEPGLAKQTESSAEELAEQTKSPAEDLAEQAESPVEEPGLAERAESFTEKLDLAKQTESSTEDLAEQAKSPVEEPGLVKQTESSTEKPDLADFKAEKELRTTVQKVTIPREPSKSRSEASRSEHNDYSKLNMIELINTLRDLLEEAGEKDVKRDIELIKAHFYKKLKEDLELRKKNFIDDGGSEEEFEYEENPYENDIKELLKEYRQRRIDYNKKLEQDKEINLQLKYEVIEEIKTLIHKEESINKTFQEFRELQKRWREIGLVPQSKVKDLWDTYHFHIENFYDYIKINQELRDLDLKKNLEIKIRLCEQAEELLLEPNVIRAFNSLQK